MRARQSAFTALFATIIGASTLTTALLSAPSSARADTIETVSTEAASTPTAVPVPAPLTFSPTAFVSRTWDSVSAAAQRLVVRDDPRGQQRARDLFYEGRVGEAREAALASNERWIAGLAAFRLRNYDEAQERFESFARDKAGDPWNASAGAYWASRAAIAAGRPERAPALLRAAARHQHTFYGQIAQRQLGIEPTGDPRLLMAAAQAGFRTAAGEEYPMPTLTPRGGFTLDRALVYAIVRQESRFNPQARSHAGATGLMQLMPGTAAFIARRTGSSGSMTDPSANLRAGQDYFHYLLGTRTCSEDILRAVAAYNGGPGTVLRTVEQLGNDTDALMLIESLPFAETRAYVERVMANYWIYRRLMGHDSRTLDAVASGERITRASLDAPVDRLMAAASPVQQVSIASVLHGAP